MKIKKLLLVAAVQAVLFNSMATAGDVEVQLPAATDAFTIDQPAGTELMRVHGDGNVGIGTATPGSILEINSIGPKLSITDSDSTKGIDGHNQAIQFKDGNGDITAKVGFGTANQILYFQNGNTGGSIRFSADETTEASSAADMTIDTDGDVGIGTTNPEARLEVVGDSTGETAIFKGHKDAPVLYLDTLTNDPGQQTRMKLKAYRTSDGKVDYASIGNLEGDLALSGNGDAHVDPHMVIENSSGDIGIGTTEPTTKLDIYDNSETYITLRDGDSLLNEGGHHAAIQIRDSNGDRTAYLGFGTGAEGISYNNYNDDGGHHFSTAAATNRLVVHANGNVGVKISTPTTDFHVRGAGLFSEDLEVGGNLKVADAGVSCDATTEGQIRYEASLKKHQGCDGTSWNNLY